MFKETVSRESSKAAKMTFRLNGLLQSARLTGNAKGSSSTDIRTHTKNTAPVWGCTRVISRQCDGMCFSTCRLLDSKAGVHGYMYIVALGLERVGRYCDGGP